MLLVMIGLSSGVCRAQSLLAPIILTPPSAASVHNGDTVKFTVGLAVSLFPVTYQWYLNNVAISGATQSSLTVTNANSKNVGQYCVAVHNTFGTTVSTAALLSLLNPVVSVVTSALSSSGFALHLTIPPGSNYLISASSGGVSGWTPIYTNTSATGSVDFTDASAVNYSSRFYRVQLK
jgi:hypothetical protein